jgi:hypothetical protein
MFVNAQYHKIMKTIHYISKWIFSLALVGFLASCASVNSLPEDDIYYSKKNSNSSLTNGNLSQSSTPAYSSPSNVSASGDEFDYSSQYQGYVGEEQATNGLSNSDSQTEDDYEFIDEYYDSDYESRINRFNESGNSSNFGYYDDYYSGDGCNCGSDFSLSFGFGMGYGYGGYGYGYPYYGYGYGYPYYGYGYPYYGYGYPYYGYYPPYYPYYPYYPDYGYYGGGYVYGPRNGSGGGTTIPRSGTRDSGEDLIGSDKTVIAGGRSAGTIAGGGGTVATSISTPGNGSSDVVSNDRSTSRTSIEDVNSSTVQERETVQVQDRSSVQTQERMSKPDVSTQTGTVATSRYQKPVTSKSNTQQSTPRYEKPKSYQSLPSQKPRSSQEYVKPVNNTSSTSVNRSNPYSRPSTQQSKSNVSGSNVNKSNPVSTTPGRNYNSTSKTGNSSGTGTPSRSYTSPSRSSGSGSSSGSYSSPSRSSGSSGGGGGGGVSTSRSSSSGNSSGGGKR